MGYKIPGLPSAQAYIEEKADFWEVNSLINKERFYTHREIAKSLSIELDEINHDGTVSEDDIVDNELDDVFSELNNRINYSNSRYPFKLGKFSLKYEDKKEEHDIIYTYLLLCTRFNMTSEKIQNDLDGTEIFEKLCAEVAKSFFGKSAESFVFGTAEPGNFEKKIGALIKKTGVGLAFKNPNNNDPTKNDDAVDIVVWKEFSDKRQGKLIGFGQCKTGTSWRDSISKLKPINFCDSWLSETPIFKPLPLIFITDTINIQKNFYTDQSNYLFFNRFRIMEYLPENLPKTLMSDIKLWLEGALSKIAV